MANFLAQLKEAGALDVWNPMAAKAKHQAIRSAQLDSEGKALHLSKEYLKQVDSIEDYSGYYGYVTKDLQMNKDLFREPGSFASESEFEDYKNRQIMSSEELLKAKRGDKVNYSYVDSNGRIVEGKMYLDDLQKAQESNLFPEGADITLGKRTSMFTPAGAEKMAQAQEEGKIEARSKVPPDPPKTADEAFFRIKPDATPDEIAAFKRSLKPPPVKKTPTTAMAAYLAQGKRTPDEIAAFQQKLKSGIQVFDPNTGNLIVDTSGKSVDRSAVGKSTKTQLEKDIIEGAKNIASFKKTSELFKPEYLTYWGKGADAVRKIMDKADISTGEQKKLIKERQKWFRQSKADFIAYRKWATGVAGGEKELAEIATSFPDPVKNSPEEYMANLESLEETTKDVLLTNVDFLRSGIDTDQPLDKIFEEIKQRGLDIQDITSENSDSKPKSTKKISKKAQALIDRYKEE